MVYIFLADGFEEIEALTPYDALKRADIEVNLVGIEKLNITGAHGIKVTADISQDEVDFSDMSKQFAYRRYLCRAKHSR